ncbi:hypothetical protein P7M38_24940, partial [Vibrio parahaemolyticus]|nr:hypothetical protein [Vibrio parahaemolyticus]
MEEILEKLYENKSITKRELIYLIDNADEKTKDNIKVKAKELSRKIYGNKIYIRGLIEFSNYCNKNCMYCG